MQVYFVRHGQTEYNQKKLATGGIDIPLTIEGIKQIEDITSKIPSTITAIYSSDLIRCKQTADIINKNLNVPITYDARLRGRSFGMLEGTPLEDFDQKLCERDKEQRYDYRPFGGESIDQVTSRLISLLKELHKRDDDTILVVTSGAIIRLLHNAINKQVIEVIHNSSLHVFDIATLLENQS
ncbi:MAG: histidine phosphatase family protein [Candidatus Pacebacteria bacterium]|nr:histidine phosphatase family protein [Candidatus Paceibacterota bacterium]